jgi:hypothetical protein
VDEVEVWVAADGIEVLEAAGGEVVEGDDRVSAREQTLDEVGADEPAPACDQVARHELVILGSAAVDEVSPLPGRTCRFAVVLL